MDILIIIIKCLIIVAINISLGWLISYSWHFYLFYPRKIYLWGKHHFYFSPGLFYRKKKDFIKYLHKKIKEYFEYAKKDFRNVNFLTSFEKNTYNEIFAFIKKNLNNEWLPKSVKHNINQAISCILWVLIRHITRSVIPRLMIELQIDYKIDLLDLKLDINILRKVFLEHIYKYFYWFNLIFFTFVGILNMIIFLILR
ncbi:MAG: hypothetical protein FWG98_04525 [Candidatus Cloacimonetes bacterium]|nr:hypothetical protein [Candidatus Cloacimonadota bacterium]